MYITTKWLKKHRACSEEQVRIFTKEWPEGGEVTVDTLKRAVALDLDLEWFVKALRVPTGAEEKQVRTDAWTQYNRAVADAWATYLRVIADHRIRIILAHCRKETSCQQPPTKAGGVKERDETERR